MDYPALNDYSDGLYFLPLGGTDAIGMNCYLYGVDGRWLMVDCGVAFGDENTPGIDILVTRPDFIEQRRDALDGIVLTHAHEDHFGAIQYLWNRFKCPVYATPFTAAYLRMKLQEADPDTARLPLIEVPVGGSVDIGPFGVDFLTVTHSIPEPNALAIRTAYGTVLHSGDWKLDPEPTLGPPTDEPALRRLGDGGVLALVGDSTNAMVPGSSGHESDAAAALKDVIARQTGRVAVTCFASNVARVKAIAEAAHAAGRHAALVGRSLLRVTEAARLTGWFDLPDRLLSDREAAHLPPDRVVLICTGSQGEPRAALTRIAHNDHPSIVLERGDTVIYSAREIPGNEPEIERIQSLFLQRGVAVITPDDEPVHVSGHPAHDELVRMYQWVRPQVAVPMHGSHKHLVAHAAIAEACQVPTTVIPQDGSVIKLAPGTAAQVDRVPITRLGLDGKTLIALDSGRLAARRRLADSGILMATVVIDSDGELMDDVMVATVGMLDPADAEAVETELSDAAGDAIDDLPRARRRDDKEVEDTARLALRRLTKKLTGKKPMVEVRVLRLEE